MIIGAMLLFLVGLLIILLLSVWSVNFYLRHSIGFKHHTIQYIIETGEIPENWLRKFERQRAVMRVREPKPEEIARFQIQIYQRCLRELDRLIRYLQHTRLVQGEETRSLLLEDLKRIRSEWEGRKRYELSV